MIARASASVSQFGTPVGVHDVLQMPPASAFSGRCPGPRDISGRKKLGLVSRRHPAYKARMMSMIQILRIISPAL